MMTNLQTPTHLMPHTVSTSRATQAAGNTGGSPKESWSASLSGVKGFMQPASDRQIRLYGTDRASRVNTFYTSPGQDFAMNDRVTFSTSRTGSAVARVFRVVGIRDACALNILMEIDCEAVEGLS